MSKKLLAVAAIAVLAVPASAVQVHVQDYFSALDLVATDLGLEYSLPEDGLEACWPGEVEEIGDLASIATTVKDADVFNKEMGEGSDYKVGDIVILTATESPGEWGVEFLSRGEGSWNNPDLTIDVSVGEFMSTLDKAGIEASGPAPLALCEGMVLPVTVKDVEAFKGAWQGEAEIAEGATGALTLWADEINYSECFGKELPVSGFRIDEGTVVKTR